MKVTYGGPFVLAAFPILHMLVHAERNHMLLKAGKERFFEITSITSLGAVLMEKIDKSDLLGMCPGR
jgi:hypothetical protein